MELFAIPEPHEGTPLITAHAGCEGTEPNSRESIVAAYNSPADIVEVDVRVSADGVVFLMHDNAMVLSDNEIIPVEHLPWDEIRNEAQCRQGYEVLSFEAFCDLIEELEHGTPRRTPTKRPFFNLDIKNPSALPSTATIVRLHTLEHRVMFSGLDERGIALAALCIPEMAYFFNADSLLSDSRQAEYEEARLEEACSLALRHGCKGINLEWTRASAAMVRSIHQKGLFVMLWTVDAAPDIERVLGYGPDAITTHYPERLARMVKEKRESGSGPTQPPTQT